MVNNDIITKDTGWQKPNLIEQDSRYGMVNQYTCYAYANLERIKKKDGICAYIPSTGGVNKTHASPRVYCSGFNFNIPSNATIKKVLIRQTRQMGTYTYDQTYIKDKMIKLKNGVANINSTDKDYGVGNNLSEGTMWNVKTRGLGTHITGDKMGKTVQDLWGVYLTPAMVNNQNFGCVLQCEGSGKTWHMPWIDCVEMLVEYSQVADGKTAPSTTSEYPVGSEKDNAVQLQSMIVTEYQPDDSEVLQATQESISEDYVYTPFNLWVRYRNFVDDDNNILPDGYNGIITVTVNENLRFIDGTRTMKIPAFDFKYNTDEKDVERGYKSVFKTLNVYPVKAGTGVIKATGLWFEDKAQTQTINVHITPSEITLSNSSADLNRVTFTNCKATKGTAIYNLGTVTYTNLKFNDLSSTDKCFYDFDKYRDSEFR